MEATKTQTNNGKLLTGMVVSNKMTDTIVVEVTRFIKNAKYGKFMKQSKKFKVHDAGNTAHIGDKVEIVETRPISKDKHFKLSNIVSKKMTEEISS